MLKHQDVAIHAKWWHETLGANIVGVKERSKDGYAMEWKQWQYKEQTWQDIEGFLNNGQLDGGFAVMAGELWRGIHKGKHLACIDLDNKEGVEAFCPLFGGNTLEEVGKTKMVIWHVDNKNKGKVIIISEIPLPQKQLETELPEGTPRIEIKSKRTHLFHVPPAIHKNGTAYSFVRRAFPLILTLDQTNELVQKIEAKCSALGLDKLGKKTSKPHWEPVKEGARDQTAFNNALSCLKYGFNPSFTLDILIAGRS